MEWITAENVIAVVTSLLGVLVSVGAVLIDRFRPQRARIAYRVQLNTPLHREGDSQDGPLLTVKSGSTTGVAEPTDGSSLVLLRIENDGDLDIGVGDYRDPEPGQPSYGLKVTFGDARDGVRVQGVVATVPRAWRPVWTALRGAQGAGLRPPTPRLEHEGNEVRVPKVPLVRSSYFKLLVQLSGPVADHAIEVGGGLRTGEPTRSRSTTLDENPPRFSPTARTVTIVLTACVIALAAIIVRERTPPPIGCARGTLTVTGSTAFAPAVREAAKAYEEDCPGAVIAFDTDGSTSGVRDLAEAGRKAGRGEPPAVIALSDGRGPNGYPRLREHMVAVSLFTLVAHDGVPVRDLTLDQVRALYRGEIRNWRELGGPDRPVLLVSRDADSGTREVFQRRVLGRNEPAHSSRDCHTLDDPEARVIRCELDSTEQVLSTVAALPGALGYSELRATDGRTGLHRIAIDGRRPLVEELGESPYPYREIEYAYTWGDPVPGSLTSSFLTYLSRGIGQDVVRAHGHLPCTTPKGLRICGGG